MPSARYLLGWALALLVALVAAGWLLSRVVHDDGIGRADAGLSRWLARRRSGELNDVTAITSELGGTLTITVLAALTVGFAAWVWRRWREPLLVAVAVAGEVGIFLAVALLVDRERPPVRHLDGRRRRGQPQPARLALTEISSTAALPTSRLFAVRSRFYAPVAQPVTLRGDKPPWATALAHRDRDRAA